MTTRQKILTGSAILFAVVLSAVLMSDPEYLKGAFDKGTYDFGNSVKEDSKISNSPLKNESGLNTKSFFATSYDEEDYCNDSDGGFQVLKVGTLSTNYSDAPSAGDGDTDSCISDTSDGIIEYYCCNTGTYLGSLCSLDTDVEYPASYSTSCNEGYHCQDGACIKVYPDFHTSSVSVSVNQTNQEATVGLTIVNTGDKDDSLHDYSIDVVFEKQDGTGSGGGVSELYSDTVYGGGGSVLIEHTLAISEADAWLNEILSGATNHVNVTVSLNTSGPDESDVSDNASYWEIPVESSDL